MSVGAAAAASAASPPDWPRTIAAIDLARPFATRSPWRVTAVQDAPVEDPIMEDHTEVPGAIRLCLRNGPAACVPQLDGKLTNDGDALYSEPHELEVMRLVYPRGTAGRPLLLVQAGSLHSVNGNQLRRTQVLAYDRTADRFHSVYDVRFGRNNNEEVRYLASEPLRGSMISIEPTQDAPFGFWVTVNAFMPSDRYRQVLRYRSVTRYGDGNPLAVIDSEMPNIQRHLGLWRPGRPLPLPAGSCSKPHLVGMELWCT